MKKIYPIIVLCMLCTLNVFAQSPQGINYQSLVRDAAGTVLRSQAIGLQFSIHQNTANGPVVYTETFASNTNTFGLINVVIGTGSSSNNFSSIDWANGPFFIETAIDVSGGTSYSSIGTSQFESTPYALYSNTASFADSADYNSLSNKPTTITNEQVAKIDLLSVNAPVDLDQMNADVSDNNAKLSFPGFGTTPGYALEGNNTIWEKSDTNIFYNTGNVGIGVPTNSSFGGAKLHVSGGILYDGVPSSFAPGLLYYDDSGDGVFHYIDNTNANYELGPGAISYTDTLWQVLDHAANPSGNTPYQDVVTDKFVVMGSSLGVGMDVSQGEDFGFNTLILKENNLRILFDDSDDPNGTMPANDWQIEANSSSNGGTSHFAINDITNETTPFKIIANAPNNSFYVSETGKVGIGTNTPSHKLTVNGAIKAEAFIGDGSGLTGITGGTGGLSSIDTLTFGADTDEDTSGAIAFQTQNSTRMIITNEGKVGIGTEVPTNELDVVGSGSFHSVQVSGATSLSQITYNITNESPVTSDDIVYDVSNKSVINFGSASTQVIQGFTNGTLGQELTIINTGEPITVTHNGTGLQKILLPASADITINNLGSARFVYDGTSWYCIGKNN